MRNGWAFQKVQFWQHIAAGNAGKDSRHLTTAPCAAVTSLLSAGTRTSFFASHSNTFSALLMRLSAEIMGLVKINIRSAPVNELTIMTSWQNIHSCLHAGTMRKPLEAADLFLSGCNNRVFQQSKWKGRKIKARLHYVG